MTSYGYARVSTRDQDLSAQIDALKAAGADPIYREKISGVRADRPQLAKLMASLRAGDMVIVTKIDRLGRSTRELLDLIERIGKAGASFRSLGDPLFDTTGAQGRLLVTVLAAIAEFERELIRERTGAGRERAMAAGIRFGRKPKLSDYQRAEAVKRRAAGETLADIAKSYGVSLTMISRLPYHDTTLSQELLGVAQIGVRVPVRGDFPLARYVPRAKIKEARTILAKQKAGQITDSEALNAINQLGTAP
jgi:DNA invertase Pin-like site-specific DNA recombinase